MKKLTLKKLEELLVKAKKAHTSYEKKIGKEDKNWSKWYARFIIDKIEYEKKLH